MLRDLLRHVFQSQACVEKGLVLRSLASFSYTLFGPKTGIGHAANLSRPATPWRTESQEPERPPIMWLLEVSIQLVCLITSSHHVYGPHWHYPAPTTPMAVVVAEMRWHLLLLLPYHITIPVSSPPLWSMLTLMASSVFLVVAFPAMLLTTRSSASLFFLL